MKRKTQNTDTGSVTVFFQKKKLNGKCRIIAKKW